MRPLPVLLLCILTTTGGFFAGRRAPANQQENEDPGNPERTATRLASRTDRPASTAPGETLGVMRDAKPGKPQAALAAAMKDALGGNMEAQRLGKWMKLLSAMRPEDAPAIAEFLAEEAASGRKHSEENTTFWQTWTTLDPAGAWAYSKDHFSNTTENGAKTVIKAWAMIDPTRAGEAVLALENSPMAEQAREGLLHGLAESNSAVAVDFVSRHLPADLQETAAVHIGGSIVGQLGNQEAQTWFDQLPADVSPVFQKETARVLMEALSRASSADVENFAMARMDQPWAANPDEQSFTAAMISRGGGSPWNYVSAAVEKYPNADSPLALAQQVAYRQSPDASRQWLDAHPDAPDAVLGGIALGLLNRGRVEEGEKIVARISDTSIREKVDAGRTITVGGLQRSK